MIECYQGINIPTQITEPCGNIYMSTNCVTIPEPLIYLDLPTGASQTDVNENLILGLKTVNDRVTILEEESGGGAEQNNFVRYIFIDADTFSSTQFTKQELITAVLALPANQRTILDTDSVTNIGVGYPAFGSNPEYVYELYELQNTGKGVITSISEENLFLKMGGLDRVLDFGYEVIGKIMYMKSNDLSLTTSLQHGVIDITNSGTDNIISINNTLSNGARIEMISNTRGLFFNSNQIDILNFTANRGYTIHLPDPGLGAVNGLMVNFPVDMSASGNYTLALREDMAETVTGVTSPLTVSILNSNWSTKPKGFRVQCPNITTGAIIYEKTDTGWLSINANIVT